MLFSSPFHLFSQQNRHLSPQSRHLSGQNWHLSKRPNRHLKRKKGSKIWESETVAATGSRQSTPLSTIRTRYGNSASTPESTRTCETQQNSLQKGSRYGISVSIRTLTLQFLFFFFSISLLFLFSDFPCFFVRFPFISKDFRGSAKRKPLLFSGFPLLLRKQGLEGQGTSIADAIFADAISETSKKKKEKKKTS